MAARSLVVALESELSVAVESEESVVEEPLALPVEDEPVEEALREELELEGTAAHQAVFCDWAAKRLGSVGRGMG